MPRESFMKSRLSGKEWRREDIRILKKIFPNIENSRIAMLLDRSVEAVEKKARMLGLKKTKKYLKQKGQNKI